MTHRVDMLLNPNTINQKFRIINLKNEKKKENIDPLKSPVQIVGVHLIIIILYKNK